MVPTFVYLSKNPTELISYARAARSSIHVNKSTIKCKPSSLYRRILQLCPPLCMLALSKVGREHGIITFPCDDHYRLSNTTWACDLCTFSGCQWAKLEKNNKVRHNMTQIACLLAVATVFAWFLGSNIYILQSEGGLYARQNYLCRNLR